MTRPVGSLLDRWQARVLVGIGDECWGWTGRHDRDGYAHLDEWISTDKWRDRGAHIIAWEMFNRPVPGGCVVHHRCENKSCVNPDHLELMTRGAHQRMHQRREWCRSGMHRLEDEKLPSDGRRFCSSCATIAARIRYRERNGIAFGDDPEIAAFLAARQ